MSKQIYIFAMFLKHKRYMIHIDAELVVQGGVSYTEALQRNLQRLADGNYRCLVLDNAPNKALPFLKYLFGVVLKDLSDKTGIPVDALYKYFEDKFAPVRHAKIDGKIFEYKNIKDESSQALRDFTERIITFAEEEWGIKAMERDALKAPEAAAPYAEAYTDQWKSFFNK